MVALPKNDEEATEMEAKAAAYRREQAKAELDARREQVAPLLDFVESDEFQVVLDKAAELAPDFASNDGIDVHLRPLPRFMRNLREALAAFVPPAAPAPAPTPSGEPDPE